MEVTSRAERAEGPSMDTADTLWPTHLTHGLLVMEPSDMGDTGTDGGAWHKRSRKESGGDTRPGTQFPKQHLRPPSPLPLGPASALSSCFYFQDVKQ